MRSWQINDDDDDDDDITEENAPLSGPKPVPSRPIMGVCYRPGASPP